MAERKMDFPSNSDKSKNPEAKEKPSEKKVEKVITSVVVQRKKSLGTKIKETFTGEDARSVGSYLLFDVIIPAAKNMLADAASQGAERMLFGGSRRGARSSGVRREYTSYNRMYRADNERDTSRSITSRSRATHDFDEIVIDNRGEAEEVLDNLAEMVAKYGVATVTDLYDLVGIDSDFTDHKWGWQELRTAQVRRVREGYLLDLPRPAYLD